MTKRIVLGMLKLDLHTSVIKGGKGTDTND